MIAVFIVTTSSSIGFTMAAFATVLSMHCQFPKRIDLTLGLQRSSSSSILVLDIRHVDLQRFLAFSQASGHQEYVAEVS